MLYWSRVYAKSRECASARRQRLLSKIIARLYIEATEVRKLSEQGYGNYLEPSLVVPCVCEEMWEEADNMDELEKPGSFLEENRGRKHLLLRFDDNAMK